MKKQISIICAAALAATACAADWKNEIVFRATFDGSLDAQVAGGDPKLYQASSYKEQASAQPGLDGTDVLHAKGEGHSGDALRFTRKNTRAVFYKAQGNVPFDAKNWSGTISFWLQLDPEQDLEPGFCDPIQVTDKAYNDSAIWVDFTKDDKPRHFRLGVFGALKMWNPSSIDPDKNPGFSNRLVVVKRAPFARNRWTHVAITHARLGSGAGEAELYLYGTLQGAAPKIAEPFEWDIEKGAIRLGVNYVGLMDDIAIFRRALTAREVASLAAAREW
ncbi:MAG: LamG-like jellyroll fold domain-containing protein [Verrucomicrobiota bacterium]